MMLEKSFNRQFLEAIKNQKSYKGSSEKKIDYYMKPQITLGNVNTVYEGERYLTLYDINLKIHKGEFILIIGPNGSGKTTLLETILGMLPIQKGTININGKSIFKNVRHLRKKIGYLIQGIEFDPKTPFLVKTAVMTARAGRLGLLKFPKKADREIARYCYDAIRNKQEVEDYWEKPIGKLSGGMQQKVRIANILAAEPEILLLDEPFANLDINARQEMFELFLRLNKLANITILCVTHRQELSEDIDRIIMIQKGRIVLDAEPEVALKSDKYKAYCKFM
ncbi:MAG: ATP-binding cassette domain-containing protein [Candidatus Lokiarchaeota archaeon]|nr:ATP-binding cassette domain-containing protein [Candidatus Lokiarchaeota archaeon]